MNSSPQLSANPDLQGARQTRPATLPAILRALLHLAASLCLLAGPALADTTAPAVAITFPTNASTYTTTITSLQIRGTATDSVGVTQVTWTKNAGGSGTATLGAGTWNSGIGAIPLQLGANLITVTAFDAAGNTSTDTLTVTRQTPSPTTYYVAPGGLDTNNGTSLATPFLTIQKGVNSAGAAPGNTVYVRGGTYRERVELNGDGNKGGEPGNYVNILAYPGETPILKGSQIVTGWALDSGSVWKKTGWTVNSQQVFVDFDTSTDKHPLQQIGSPPNSHTFENTATNEFPNPNPAGMVRGDMVPGTFFWESSSNTLYVWLADNSNPNTHVMEASTQLRTLFFNGTKGHFYIKGLTFYHNNASANKPASPVGLPAGAMVQLDRYCVLDSCNVEWSDFAGVHMGSTTGSVITDCTISNNGCMGITGQPLDCKITDSLISANNYRGWNRLWAAGGIKLASGGAYGTVERNEVANNNGSGIWFDQTGSANVTTIRNNYVHNNGPTDAGIMFEISSNVEIYNNLLVENERRGVYISGSDNARVYNNTIVRQKGRAAIELDGMPRAGHTLTNNLVYNNIIYNNTATNSTYDLFIRQNNGNDVSGNASDYNCIYRSIGAIQLNRRSTSSPVALNSDTGVIKSNLTDWRTFTGWDTHSISADPAFVIGVGIDWTLSITSPAKDTGGNFAEVATDFNGVTRPQGSSTDMGAFERDASSPTAVINVPTSNPNFTTTSSFLNLGGTATDNVGVVQVSWTNSLGGNGAAAGTGAWNATAIPLQLGANVITVTANDAAGNPGSAVLTVTRQTIYEAWASQSGLSGPNAALSANPDGDLFNNLLEFAFGTDPNNAASGPGSLTYSAGGITLRGQPTVSVTNTGFGVDFRAVFGRRKDYVAAGLTYTVQFSADMSAGSWEDSAATPTVIALDAEMDAVAVPYPFFLSTGQKAQFFRVMVTGP